MIPPSPLQFSLWGSALYTELATGLWRALAAPWLQPGWPASAGARGRRAPDPRPAAHPTATIAAADGGGRAAAPDGGSEPAPTPEPSERRVIEVPRGRWQRRRARGATAPTEG
jgi:hypothetical protein